ncbi:MAG: ribosome-associated translation inhibitor RaiA [Candidatus Eisenbacteria bacterium]
MNISTTARHCELDPEVRIFVQQRLERLLRYFRDPRDLMEAHVVVAAEKYRHSAEITLKLRRGEIVGREQADDPRAAIELAAERLEHQIRRLKERRLDRKRGGRAREVALPAAAETPSEDEALQDLFDEPPAPSGNGGTADGVPMEE